MDSVVGGLRRELQEHGEYVVLANAASGWFAVFPRTWRIRSDAAQRHGRAGPTLIVYRTTSDDPRDHHAIPFAVIRDLLTDDTLTHSKVNGSQRWNLTLKNDRLHVTHRPGYVDVGGFRGAPLFLEDFGATSSTTARGAAVSVLEGMAREMATISRSRSGRLRELALKRSEGRCEACRVDYSTLLGGRGRHALHVHHKKQLAAQQTPTVTRVEDLAVVCANCHAILHADPENAMSVEALRELWAEQGYAVRRSVPSIRRPRPTTGRPSMPEERR